jgi:hypothetical protein
MDKTTGMDSELVSDQGDDFIQTKVFFKRLGLHRPVHFLVFFLPVLYFGVMLAIFVFNHSLFWKLLNEDGLLEYFQAANYLLAGTIAVGVGLRLRQLGQLFLTFFYIILTSVLFFAAIEEISWGQRIIGVETPEIIYSESTQGELNVHNLEFVQNYLLHEMYIVLGIGSGVGWIFVSIPFLRKYKSHLDYIIPKPITMLYFLPVGLYYIYLEGVLRSYWPDFGGTKPQEMFETPFSLAFVVFTLINHHRLSRKRRILSGG